MTIPDRGRSAARRTSGITIASTGLARSETGKERIVAKVVPENKKWETEADARTLIEAEEIKGDKRRYRRAMVEVRKQKKAADRTVNAAIAIMGRK